MRGRLNSYERALLAGVAVVIAIALARSAEDEPQHAGGPGNDAQAALPLSPSRVRSIESRVERIRELRFVRPVRPLFLDRRRAERLIDAQTRQEYSPSERVIDEEELKLLGLLRPADDLEKAIETVGAQEILGFYDPRTKRLVVVRGEAASRALLEITLAHELVHALEDQRFSFRPGRGLGDDAALAESAVAEGTATEVMTDYAARHFESGALLDVALGAAAGGGSDLPEYVEQSLLFPYEQGQKFVAGFRGRDGGWRALNKVLRLRQPRSAEQVLHPRKYAVDEKPVRVRALDADKVLGKGWRRVDSTSVGEFDVRALYDIVGGSPAPAAAAGWGGGRFELWRLQSPGAKPCRSPCVARDVGILRLAWDSPGDRVEAEERLPRVFERGLDGKRVSSRKGLGLWLSRGGAVGMSGRGRDTTIVLAPDPRLAARLLILAGR